MSLRLNIIFSVMRFIPLLTSVALAIGTVVASWGHASRRSVLSHQGRDLSRAANLASRAPTIEIPVYFHVVSKGPKAEDGNAPDSQITATINVLNKEYKFMGIKFNLVEITRTVNTTWFDKAHPFEGGVDYEVDMKMALHKGDKSTLNIYSVGFTEEPNDIMGYSYPPEDLLEIPDIERDGTVVRYIVLAGGPNDLYDKGHQVVREVGLWLGLLDVFGMCDVEGDDGVEDTPSEATPFIGDRSIKECPEKRDPCPNDARNYTSNPNTNFMNLGHDACMDHFTPGQKDRILDQIAMYRGL